MLSNYLHSHDDPAAVHPSETDLEVDKYLSVLAEMKYPFEVSMFRDGSLFKALPAGLIEDPIVSLDLHFDPVSTQMVPGAPIGIYGFFWAVDTDAAVQLADQFRLQQIEAGNL